MTEPNHGQDELGDAEPWLRYRRIGPYKIQGELGQGGTGLVLLGIREDDTRKQVAVKVLKRGMDSGEILHRFYQERTILASLSHPYIAQLYDVGCTEDGLPYFVMEYVDGLSLVRYAAARRLTLHARLKLFLRICEAVNYAHQKLVVHRDLKPANILVTQQGDPKLLDFGIAGLVRDDPEAVVTDYHQRMLTLEYASPEQLRGEPLGTTTDVYSSGVILYELLTGKRPFQFTGKNALQAADQLASQTMPPRPSATVPRRKLSTLELNQISDAFKGSWYRKVFLRLRGSRIDRDLDRIVLKALQFHREDRYASIEALAGDVRRYLRGLPIKARPQSFGYRVSRFFKRNRLPILASVLAAGLLLGSTVQAWRKQQEAALQRDKTEVLVAFMTDLFQLDGSVDAYGDEVSAKLLLDRAARLLGQDLDALPTIRGELRFKVGQAYDGLGLYQDAWHVFQDALRDTERAYGPDSLETAEVLFEASLLASEGRFHDQVRMMLERALKIRIDAYGEQHKKVWEVLSLLGYHYQIVGELSRAESYYRRSYEGRLKHLGEDDPDLMESINQLSIIAMHDSQCEKAADGFKRVIDHSTRTTGPLSRDTVAVLGNLGLVYVDCGNYEQAIAYHSEQLQRSRRIYQPNHPYLAAALIFLADAMRAGGRLTEAEALLQEGLEVLGKTLHPDHNYYCKLRLTLGRTYCDMGRYDLAEAELKQALRINLLNFGPTHYRSARIHMALADLAYRRDDLRGAENDARKALEIFERLYGPNYFRTAYARVLVGVCLIRLGRVEEGERFAMAGYQVLTKVQPDGEYTRLTKDRLGDLGLNNL